MNTTSDGSFGPQLRPKIDFTLLFEQTILTILPSALLLLIAPLYILRLCRRPVCARSGIRLWAKLVVAAVLVGLELAKAVLWAQSSASVSTVSLVAVTMSYVCALGLGAMLYVEHSRSLRPSTILSVYLTISIVFDAVKSRSLFLRPGLLVSASLSAAVTALKVGLLLLEEISRRSLIPSKYLPSNSSSELISGFWSRYLFVWLNSTLLIGFRSIIRVQDLRDVGPELASERLLSKFESFWKKSNKSSACCLFNTCLRTLILPVLAVVLPRLCLTEFRFAQPFLVQSVVVAIGQRNLSRDVVGGLIAATVLVYLGLAVTKACYMHLTYRFITMLRGILVSAIFKKTLGLPLSDTKKSDAVTLMSTDIEGIEGGLATFHDIWASVIELAVGIYLLATMVGGASFLVVLPALVTTVASFEVARRMAPARVAWNEKTQARVSTTSDVLSQIKGIKMSGVVPAVSDKLQELRVVEVKYSKKLRVLLILMHAIASLSGAIAPIIVIAGGLFWTKVSGGLNAAEAFTTLSIIALVSNPLVILLMALPQLAGTLGCFHRIQTFLLLHEGVQKRRAGDSPEPWDVDMSGPEPLSRQTTLTRDYKDFHIDMMYLQTAPESDRCVAELVNASVTVADNAEPVLRNVSHKLALSSLTMVIGPIGSGKSTLLRAFLGEAYLSQGFAHVEHGSIAYCDQTSWLQNMTLRDNILGQSHVDPTWYETVTHACMLDEDIRQLPEGDQALVGSGGVRLSGGQKQRTTLARAVYSRKPILILDDVLSALDRRTSRDIVARLFGKDGLLRKSATTVLMATHSLEYLPLADRILALDGKGNVSCQVVKEAMSSSDGLVRDFKEVQGFTTGEDSSHESFETARPTDAYQAPNIAPAITPDPAEEDSLERQRGDVALYYFYLKSIGKFLFAAWLFTVAAAAVSDRLPQIWVRIWLERDPSNNRYFAGYVALGITSGICTSVMLALYMLKLVPTSAESLHRMLLDTVMKATLSFLSSTDSGSILNRFSQDMTLVSQALPMSFGNAAYLVFCVLTDIAVIASGAKYAAAIIPLMAIVLYFVQKYYLRTSRQMRHLDLEAKSPLYTQLTETAAGVQHIRAFGWQADFLARSLRLLDYSQKPYYYMFCIQRWLTLVLDMCVLVMAVVLVTLALNFTSTTTQSAIGLALVNVIGFSETISQLITSWVELETSLGAIARLRTFLAQTPVEQEPGKEQLQVPENWPQQGRIELRSVSARYTPDDKTSPPVLNGLSVVIQPGQKVGIVGRTGSGKSSLMLTLLRLIDYSGSVTIDGIDISHMTRQQLRSRITTLPQDPVELPGSVRDNLVPPDPLGAPEGGADDAAMAEALCRVGLWQHVISRGGLDAELASMGLSQGQKQLLCLARAVLHQASTGGRVVLVDEATSSMDGETDARMQAVISEAFAGCTLLVVAHRIETIQDAHVMLELDAGSGKLRAVPVHASSRDQGE